MVDPEKNINLVEKLKDPKFYIETYFWIVDKRRNKVPFIFNPPQSKYFENRTHNDLILKSRKEGFSSLIEAIWLHACIMFKNVRAVVLSHDYESTKRHFERVRYYLEHMGDDSFRCYADLDEESQKQLRFPATNSSYWIGTAGSRAFGRGDDVTHLHFSEVAHYQNQDVLTSILEACVPDAWKVMETTANGVGEAFHRLWTKTGREGDGSVWKNHFFSWFEDPTNQSHVLNGVPTKFTSEELSMKQRYNLTERQMVWYRKKKREMVDPHLMPQEYPSNPTEAFLSTGRHVFNQEKLLEKMNLIKNATPLYVGDLTDDGRKIRLVSNASGPLRVWKPPRDNRRYLISADVAEGIPGGNFSVAHVIDRSSWEQVAVMRDRVRPGEWGKMLMSLGYFYNNAILIPENNSIGQGTIEILRELNYPHLLKAKELFPEKQPVVEGFPTNMKTRSLLINAIRNSLDEDTTFINDPTTINEMQTFIQNEKTGKMEAQQGCLDDCVMSFGIGVYALKHLALDETYADRDIMDERDILVSQSIVPHAHRTRRRPRVML